MAIDDIAQASYNFLSTRFKGDEVKKNCLKYTAIFRKNISNEERTTAADQLTAINGFWLCRPMMCKL